VTGSGGTSAAVDLPFAEAIDYLRQKTNVTSTGWTDVWQKANAKGFTVAGATTEALVEDFRREVDRALSQGTTLDEFRKGFDGIVEKHGWAHTGRPGWRSRVIYETNLSMAYSAGRYKQQTQAETLAAFPYWQYVHSGARHPRKQHLAWNGMVLAATDPFWDWAYPPNGWGCGCRVRPVSESGLKRQGRTGLDQAPERIPTRTVNRRTGEVLHGSQGVDPGFDYNPGQVWQNAPGASVPGLSPAQVAAGPVAPAEVGRFAERVRTGEIGDPAESVIAARLPEALATVLGGGRSDVELSAFRVAKVAGEAARLGGRASSAHPEITAKDWSRLQVIVDRADVFLDDRISAKGHRQLVFHDLDAAGRRLELVLRRVARPDGGERLIVPTFRQTGVRGHAKALRRLERVKR
jgi:hypothetical protein